MHCATGDAELSMLAGCEYKLGREKDELCQPMTLCFRLGGVDKKKYHENRSMMDPFEITEAEIEAREQVFELHKFLKENIPGFEDSRVLSTALQIGIRESRKIVGEYTLTEEDLLALRHFDDAIAVANYAIDIHNPEGTGTRWCEFENGQWYEIPYRCLIPKNMDNLLVAGRCISSTHEAQSSYRIMPFCAELGQAAGTAVAMARRNGTGVRDVDVKQVQEILRGEGFVI